MISHLSWVKILMQTDGLYLSKKSIFTNLQANNFVKCLRILQKQKILTIKGVPLSAFCFKTYLEIFMQLNTRPDIYAIFQTFQSIYPEGQCSVKNMFNFLLSIGVNEEVIVAVESSLRFIGSSKIDLKLLLSIILMSLPFLKPELYNSMHKNELDHELCDYYINSSHNTYLVGPQYGGSALAEPYR